jgi:DNA-binding transcriptional LysR family regulator
LDHSCIRYRYITANRVQDWRFSEGGRSKTIAAPLSMVFDSMDGVRQAVRDALGIGWGLRDMIREALDAGSLESLLDPFVGTVEPFYLFYPEQYRRLETLRSLIDMLAARQKPNRA